MGTSLEDVQVKFASIIEELSKCPPTLSQFVVWVDLCVAEYKSNGSFCLNCSGQKPDPLWLDGLKEVDEESRYSHNAGACREHRDDCSKLLDSVTSLCNNIVTIKTKKQLVNADTNNDTRCCEQTKSFSDEYTGVEAGYCKTKMCNRLGGEAQKRATVAVTYQDTNQNAPCAATPTSDHIYAMGMDSQRKQKSKFDRNSWIISRGAESVGVRSQKEAISGHLTENHSQGVYPVGLIQVASVGECVGRQNRENIRHEREEYLEVPPNCSYGTRIGEEDYGGNSVRTETPMNVSPTIMEHESGRETPVCGPHLYIHSHLVSTPGSSSHPTPIIKTESESILLESDHCNNNTVEPYAGYVVLEANDGRELPAPVKTHDADDYWSSFGTSIPGPVKKARTNVGNMHRWLHQDQNEQRQIEEIPPEELDPYLTEFLWQVRRKDGREYDPNTFKDVRGSIQRYLQDHDYPHSIVKSPLFYKSQRAYYNKKVLLRQLLFQKDRKTGTHLDYVSFQ